VFDRLADNEEKMLQLWWADKIK